MKFLNYFLIKRCFLSYLFYYGVVPPTCGSFLFNQLLQPSGHVHYFSLRTWHYPHG